MTHDRRPTDELPMGWKWERVVMKIGQLMTTLGYNNAMVNDIATVAKTRNCFIRNCCRRLSRHLRCLLITVGAKGEMAKDQNMGRLVRPF